MTLKAGVDIIGNSAPLQAALGAAAGSTEKFAATYKAAFAGMSSSTLELARAQDMLALSMDKYGAGTLGAASATLRYQKTIDSLKGSQLAAAQSIGKSLTTYVTAPVVAAGLYAVDLGTKFQSAMLRIQTQAGASGKEVQDLSGKVLDLARNGAQQGPTQLADALYYLESRGLRGAAAMDALKVASNAAALGQADLTDTANALGGAIVSNIKGAQNYQEAMGTLNAIVGGGAMTMQDLTDALGTGLLSNAKLVGVSLTEVGAALDVLVDRGVPAQQAATRLGATLKLMADPAPVAQKALAGLGIGADELASDLQKPNGLLLALQRLKEGVDSVGKVQGEQDLASAFGRSRQSSAIITLVQSLDAPVSGYGQKIDTVIAGTSRLTASEALQQKTASAQFHKDLASMEADLTGLGMAMLPAVTGIVNGVTHIGNAFADLPGPVKRDLGVIIGVLAVGGPLLLVAVGAKKAVASIGEAFGLLPARAAAGVVGADAELVTLGATADTAAGKVGTLRAALLGLGAADVLAAIAAFMAVFDSSGSAPNVSYPNKQQFPLLNQFSHFDNSGGQLGKVPGLLGEYSKYSGGKVSDSQMEAYLVKNLPALVNAGVFPKSVLAQFALAPAFPGLKPPPGYVAPGSTAATTTEPPRLPPGYKPSQAEIKAAAAGVLTPEQALQAGLYLDPNDVALLKEKLANDDKQIAEAKKLLAEGKITATKYLSLLQTYGTDRSTTEAAITSATTKTTSAANKKAAAKTRAQRLYAAGVATHAKTLMTATSAASATDAGGHLGAGRVTAADAEIAFFEAEAKDSKLTAAERARYAGDAVAAKKAENAAALKASLTYESTVISGLKARVAQAKASKSDIAGQEAALKNLIAGYESEAANKQLTPTERNNARSSAATARGQLNNLRNNPQAPLGLQLAVAKAGATDNGATDLADVQAALAIKKWDEKLLASHTLSLQGQIAIYDDIAQQNQVLGQAVTGGYARTMSASKIAAMLHVPAADKKADEMRIAQLMAHGGRLPAEMGLQGIGVPTVHIHGDIVVNGAGDPKSVAREVIRIAQGKSRSIGQSTSGPFGGRAFMTP